MRGYSGGIAAGQGSRARAITAAIIAALIVFGLLAAPAEQVEAAPGGGVVELRANDFTYGTYIIDQPGTYRLMENISFNPNSPATLDEALTTGAIPANVADMLDLSVPVDAYRAGMPLATQFQYSGGGLFTPGGPMDQRYDPAAYGVGFFAAIAIQADGVVLDLNGFTIEQSAEHALLQRFFSVIELADQPFVPNQGPASFGTEIEAAENVTIKNGTIGRSSHHGIHGNANADVRISKVDFDGYEVGAVALNGVNGLHIDNSVAINRKDVPVLGTFSSARFIGTYVDDLVRTGSTTTLTVDGATLSAADIQANLRTAINNVHHDVIGTGAGYINESAHPVEYAVFHNKHGVIDGNSYSFLVNSIGVAVNGFPLQPDGTSSIPARDVFFNKVRVVDQHSFINEVPALDAGIAPAGSHGSATIDPVGAVFQTLNTHPSTGAPVTISSLDATQARYTGNPVANAQAFVAKAALNGDLGSGHLDISRMNISQTVIDWVEGAAGSETLADIGAVYLCNGDSMFHVNKGTIAFKMDAADKVRLTNTSVDGLVNLGMPGSSICGDYSGGHSHPAATLYGYGGSAVRGYTFAGTYDVVVNNATADNLSAMSGPAIGFAVLTDSDHVHLNRVNVVGADAGWGDYMPANGPNGPAYAAGIHVGADATGVQIAGACATGMTGYDGTYSVHDESGQAHVAGGC
jgi:hypothetical protein